ncbi:sigma-70 family RNA polymerase sigma factor [soil metagenome]
MIDPETHRLQVQQLFVRHQGALKAFVYSLWPDFSEADDVLQEVFLTISAKADQFTLDSNFQAWARSIARFKVLEAQRAKRRLCLSGEAMAALEASCPAFMGDDSRLELLVECFRALPPRAKEVMRLRYHHEHGPSEIAHRLSRTVNSIHVALAKTRVVLRECMERKLQSQEAL